MNTTKPAHTPGPWTIRRTAVYDVVESAEKSICFASINEQSAANAHLLAAAPELLAALNECADELEAAIQRAVGPENAASRYHLKNVAEVARRAIAKAEGRA